MLLSLGVPIAGVLVLVLVSGLDTAFWVVSVSSFFFLLVLLSLRIVLKNILPAKSPGTIAFFHPNANGGGGGERVLWCGIRGLQEQFPNAKIVIYCAEDLSGQQLCTNAKSRFGFVVKSNIEVVYLKGGGLLDARRYPRFTLIGQAYGSVKLAFSALQKLRPQVFVDTTGWAFTYPLVRLAGVKVVTYTHYPTISTNMLLRVAQRKKMYNNEGLSSTLHGAVFKLAYYYMFAFLYGIAGGCANVVMVNSSWTRNHVGKLWWKLEEAKVVFPPCNTKELQALERRSDGGGKKFKLVSIAQFRPEKNHLLQLQAFALAKQELKSQGSSIELRLAVVGGCRNAEDSARVDALRKKILELGLKDCVDLHVDASYSDILRLLAESVAGLHTMTDEHFGISVVEYMAAGVIPIAHNSGGPKEDIVDSSGKLCCGFLCETEQEYASSIRQVVQMPQRDRQKYVENGRTKAMQFSNERFEADFLASLQNLLVAQGMVPATRC